MSRYRKQGGIIDRELKQIRRARIAQGSGKPMAEWEEEEWHGEKSEKD